MEFIETAIYAVMVRTYFYFEDMGRTNSFERFPYLKTLTERLTEEALDAWEHGAEIQESRYWELLKSIGGREKVDPVVHTALDLCLAASCVSEFAFYLKYHTDNTATLQLAFELEGISFPSYKEISDRMLQLQKICRIDWQRSPLSYATLEADHRLLAYLLVDEKSNSEPLRLPAFGNGEWFLCQEPLHPMFVHQELANECAEWLQEGLSPAVLQIAGKGGRRFLTKHIARLLGQNLFLMSAEKCREFFTETAEEQKGELIRELFWQDGILCLHGLQTEMFAKWQASEEDFWKNVVSPLLDTGIWILLCTEEHFSFDYSRLIGKKVDLKPLSREERQLVFEGFASMYGLSIDCVRYSVRYRLSAGEIASAVGLWRQEGTGTEQDFTRISTQLLNSRNEKTLGSISYPTVELADLKVPDEIQQTLEQICCSAIYGYRIFDEWGLKQQYPYGRAVTVMLTGPPGTGKTMTANGIANELGLPLYQVDLSRVMDKYIGETEKHLEQIFSFAEKTNAVLFFDEADALFGRRGEVTEGKDRYANMEVAYILQRIEQFEGIVILSTNFYKNIDKAFLRRMKYVLKYQIPNKTIRQGIWESCLPSEQFREEVDTDYLAAQFEFSGGMIKNVVLSACVIAVHKGKPLDMEHLLQAIRAEYEKMEWPVAAGMWGEYEYLMI
ncbi:MAG: ATP-binding protein [Lachnospiraceae bacterium]|nr:ATP-binding protein [Lachnospiraceae bacterium]